MRLVRLTRTASGTDTKPVWINPLNVVSVTNINNRTVIVTNASDKDTHSHSVHEDEAVVAQMISEELNTLGR